MNATSRPPTPSIADSRKKGLIGHRLAVIFLGIDAAVIAACQTVARELRIGRIDVKHAEAACAALDAFPGAMLVLSTGIRGGDWDLVEEHARRSGASITWVGFHADADADDAVASIVSWAKGRAL